MHCKCPECRARKAAIQKRYRKRVAQRKWGVESPLDQFPVGPTRQLLRDANAFGTTFREMEKLTGYSRRDLQRIANGNRKTIRRETRDTIHRAIPDPDIRAYLPDTLVPIAKAKQIARSLSAQGFSLDHQAEILRNNLGVSGSFVKHLAHPYRRQIFKKNEDIMLWLEKEIGIRTGPGKKCVTWAKKNGFYPLKHYDAKGKLLVSTLSADERRRLRGLQSSHG